MEHIAVCIQDEARKRWDELQPDHDERAFETTVRVRMGSKNLQKDISAINS